MELREYLRVLRRRWLLIVACLLLGIAGAVLLTVRTTPLYTSTARLFVSTPPSDADSASYQGAQFSEQRVTSYANLIKGTTIAQMVIVKLSLDETPTALTEQLTATAVPNTVILEVSVTDPSPARAQQIAQATAEVFSAYVPTLEGVDDPDQAPIKATIVDAATFPDSPVSPRPLLNIGLGAVLGLVVGLGLAFLRESLDTTIKSQALLQEMAGAPVLGVIGYDSGASKRPLATDLESHSPRVESFRVLRTNLQFLDVDEPSRIFAITSPLPGEGKSTTAVNLAITLAQAGHHTLLLEADLRRPRVPQYLRLEPAVGLTTVLIGRATVSDVVQPWGDIGLDVITSGAIPPNPSELLQSKAMDGVLDELRRRYDIVIVDSPPLLPVTDSALIAEKADGALLVIRSGKTTKDQVVQSAQRLASVDARLLGSVLNFAPAKGVGAYGYGYGYYGSPQSEKTPESTSQERAVRGDAPSSGTVGRSEPIPTRGPSRAKHAESPEPTPSTSATQGGRGTTDATSAAENSESSSLDAPVASTSSGPSSLPAPQSTVTSGGSPAKPQQ